jgi:hypothetical protein
MIMPVIEPSSAGGISRINGSTSFVVKNGIKYSVPGLGVSVWFFQFGLRDQW